MRRALGWLLALVTLVVLVELLRANVDAADYSRLARRRHEHAQRAKTLDIAVVAGAGEDMLWNGARDAAARVNAAGGVRGRTLRVTRFDDDADDEADRARRLARAPRYFAVIGHSPAHAKAAAVSYEVTNLLFLATSATDRSLTHYPGARVIHRLVPDDDAIAAAVASSLRTSALGSIGVLYTRASRTTDVERMTAALLAADLDIAFARPYDSIEELRRVLALEEVRPYGAVILLGTVDGNARNVIARIRATRARPAIITTSYDSAAPCIDPPVRGRLQRGHTYAVTTFCGGDARAAIGFEAVQVLAQAIARAETPAPVDVVAALRSGALFDSVRPGKRISFTPNGDVAGKEILITTVGRNP